MSEPALREGAPGTETRAPLRVLERAGRAGTLAPNSALFAFVLLFGALTSAAGHGVFLVFALTRLERIPNVAELGGLPNALVVGWFVFSVPATLAVLALRERLLRWPASRLRTVALAALVLTVATFALYLRKMVLGG